jgi:hypothetical protein
MRPLSLLRPKLAQPLLTKITLTTNPPSRKMATTTSTSDSPRKLRILMLHGYTQSGPLFHAKTKALEKSLHKAFPPGNLATHPGGISLHYPTAPIRLSTSDIPGADPSQNDPNDQPEAYGWWRRVGSGEPFTYAGLELGLSSVAETIAKEGPFDGAIGFSQGGALAGMLASLLEPDRPAAFAKYQSQDGIPFPSSFIHSTGYIEEAIQAPLKFAVSYSGFSAGPNPFYAAFYEPKITTPMMHFLGSVDTVVSEERSLRLVEACVDGERKGRVVYHPGGHFLPSSQKQYVGALVGFIREIVSPGGEAAEGTGLEKGEERVEDMELPF